MRQMPSHEPDRAVQLGGFEEKLRAGWGVAAAGRWPTSLFKHRADDPLVKTDQKRDEENGESRNHDFLSERLISPSR